MTACSDCLILTDCECAGSLAKTSSGQSFPASSGWQLDSVDLFTANFTKLQNRDITSVGKHSRADGAYFDGILFVIRVARVTRQVINAGPWPLAEAAQHCALRPCNNKLCYCNQHFMLPVRSN